MYTWEEVAKECENSSGSYVNWDERFFICPICEEVISEEDFGTDSELTEGICPVCGFELMMEEE